MKSITLRVSPVQITPLKRLNGSMPPERMRLTWPPSRFLLSYCHTTLCPIHFVIVEPRYHQPDAPITTVFCHHLSHSKAFFRDPCDQSGRALETTCTCLDWTAFEGYPDLTVRTRGAEDGLPISPLLAAFQLGTNPIVGSPSVTFPASKAGIYNRRCVRISPVAPISIAHPILYPADVCSAMRGELEFVECCLNVGQDMVSLTAMTTRHCTGECSCDCYRNTAQK